MKSGGKLVYIKNKNSNNVFSFLSFLLLILFSTVLYSQISTSPLPISKLSAEQKSQLAKKIQHYEKKGYRVILAGMFPNTIPEASENQVLIGYPTATELVIPPSFEVPLENSTRFFVEPGFKIHVAGSLRGRNITFQNIPKTELYKSEKYSHSNWLGITVSQKGSLSLEQSHLLGSDTLLYVQATESNLRLNCVFFKETSECPFVINNHCSTLNFDNCVTIAMPEIKALMDSNTELLYEKNSSNEILAKESLPLSSVNTATKNSKLSQGLVWTAVVLGIGTATLAYFSYDYAKQADEEKKKLSTPGPTPQEILAMEQNWQNLRDKSQLYGLSAFATGLATLGLGLSVYIAF